MLRKKYSAKSRKNGWILIAACLLIPLNLTALPHTHSMKIFWLVGALGLTAYHFMTYQKLCRRMKRWSRDCQDKTVQKMAADIAAELGLEKIPAIKIIAIDMPFTVGIIQTNVYLPEKDFLDKDLYYALKHELIHCKERDILWKLLFLTASIIHWFNPLVWLMRRLAENDTELACDEILLKNASKEERREYSEIVMSWIEKSGRTSEKLFLKWRFAGIFDASEKKDSAILPGAMCLLLLLSGSAIYIGAGKMIRRTNDIPLDYGIESRTDLNGDGIEDRVRTMDDSVSTMIVAEIDDVDVAMKDYEGQYSSNLVTGDLSGNGRADILLTRYALTGDYDTAEISILHLEGRQLVEYPYNFIPNPDIHIKCPTTFEPHESMENGDLYIDATLFQTNGKTMVRFLLFDCEEQDKNRARIIEASYRDEGWYIENAEVTSQYHTKRQYEDLLSPIYKE